MSSTGSDDPLPGVPGVGTQELDAMVDAEAADPREELSKTDHDTDLGIAMAEDAKRVSRGELTADAYWEKYDEAAAAEFGDAYRETPNPSIEHPDQTISSDTAESPRPAPSGRSNPSPATCPRPTSTPASAT
jgi:hypothetical protein